MTPAYMVIRVELRATLDVTDDEPRRCKESAIDLRQLAAMRAGAPAVVDQTAIMLARTMWDEAVLMGAGDE